MPFEPPVNDTQTTIAMRTISPKRKVTRTKYWPVRTMGWGEAAAIAVIASSVPTWWKNRSSVRSGQTRSTAAAALQARARRRSISGLRRAEDAPRPDDEERDDDAEGDEGRGGG